MKILTIDIETRPNLAYVWELFDQRVITIEQLVQSKEMLCFGAKWYEDDEIIFRSQFHDSRETMVRTAWDLLNEANAVVHYNGTRFDIPHINREFLQLDLTPPAPYNQVDLMLAIKKHFRFASNKLAHITRELGIGEKIEHEGFGLWLKCMNGDAEAWDRMKEYNIQDVRLTEALYVKLRPWLPNHPSYGAETSERVCPTCGSSRLTESGTFESATGSYTRYLCEDCGKWVRDTRRNSATTITPIPVK